MSPISLTKVGNLKIGIVKNGKPIATEKILVTKATKENQENFEIYPGFSPTGEKEVKITLPFDNPELNFEVFYTSFVLIGDTEYIAKAKDYGDQVILYPIYAQKKQKPPIKMGLLDEDLEKRLGMEKTGFLKAHLVGKFGLGEVFYFKTKSINTIQAIKSQLQMLDAMTSGNTAGLELTLRAFKKDLEDKQIVYLSISYDGTLKKLDKHINFRKKSKIRFDLAEKVYEESRSADNAVDFKEAIKDAKMEVVKDLDKEEVEINNENKKKETSETEKYVSEVIKKFKCTKVMLPPAIALFKSFNSSKEQFEEFMKDNPDLPDVLRKITENTNKKG